MEAAELFMDDPEALALYHDIEAVILSVGPAQVRVSKSQVGFYRNHPFAATWRPRQYLGREAAPLVLSVYLKRRDSSPRWKQVVEPAPGHFTHHLEMRSIADIDEFVRARLTEAWKDAG